MDGLAWKEPAHLLNILPLSYETYDLMKTGNTWQGMFWLAAEVSQALIFTVQKTNMANREMD